MVKRRPVQDVIFASRPGDGIPLDAEEEQRLKEGIAREERRDNAEFLPGSWKCMFYENVPANWSKSRIEKRANRQPLTRAEQLEITREHMSELQLVGKPIDISHSNCLAGRITHYYLDRNWNAIAIFRLYDTVNGRWAKHHLETKAMTGVSATTMEAYTPHSVLRVTGQRIAICCRGARENSRIISKENEEMYNDERTTALVKQMQSLTVAASSGTGGAAGASVAGHSEEQLLDIAIRRLLPPWVWDSQSCGCDLCQFSTSVVMASDAKGGDVKDGGGGGGGAPAPSPQGSNATPIPPADAAGGSGGVPGKLPAVPESKTGEGAGDAATAAGKPGATAPGGPVGLTREQMQQVMADQIRLIEEQKKQEREKQQKAFEDEKRALVEQMRSETEKMRREMEAKLTEERLKRESDVGRYRQAISAALWPPAPAAATNAGKSGTPGSPRKPAAAAAAAAAAGATSAAEENGVGVNSAATAPFGNHHPTGASAAAGHLPRATETSSASATTAAAPQAAPAAAHPPAPIPAAASGTSDNPFGSGNAMAAMFTAMATAMAAAASKRDDAAATELALYRHREAASAARDQEARRREQELEQKRKDEIAEMSNLNDMVKVLGDFWSHAHDAPMTQQQCASALETFKRTPRDQRLGLIKDAHAPSFDWTKFGLQVPPPRSQSDTTRASHNDKDEKGAKPKTSAVPGSKRSYGSAFQQVEDLDSGSGASTATTEAAAHPNKFPKYAPKYNGPKEVNLEMFHGAKGPGAKIQLKATPRQGVRAVDLPAAHRTSRMSKIAIAPGPELVLSKARQFSRDHAMMVRTHAPHVGFSEILPEANDAGIGRKMMLEHLKYLSDREWQHPVEGL